MQHMTSFTPFDHMASALATTLCAALAAGAKRLISWALRAGGNGIALLASLFDTPKKENALMLSGAKMSAMAVPVDLFERISAAYLVPVV